MLTHFWSARLRSAFGRAATVGTLVLACSLLSHGCGYTVGSTLPVRYQTVHIPPARNSIKEYDLQAPLTNALIRKFMVDRRLRVVDTERADLQLVTDIRGYSLTPISYDDQDRVVEFRVTVVVAARLTDVSNGEELWRDERVRGTSSFMSGRYAPSATPRGNTDFFASTVRSFPSGNEGEAATEALEDLASQILYLTVEHW
jgi:outer membrane lipopolysaccharide assembly protein LptE/RlpB